MAEEQNKNGSFGEYLRHQREIRGFSLEEISSQTRIGLRNLKALEAEDWEVLPAEIYIRGFIRSYCETIGLDPNEALIRFEEAYAPFRRHKEEKINVVNHEVSFKEFPWRLIIILIVVVLLVAGGYFFFFKEEKKSITQLSPLLEEIPVKKEQEAIPQQPAKPLPKSPASNE
ncbi:helix-turn-helix domain-containing protein [Thermodesulfatator autotrophicus]|uniref:DUF4115 domain-containing protein n=1 Tax=Thermodesulfatator autotrophicus TaxID=1795632 RepID=A0A177E7Z5_9BACT|nr:helix-turn-helix domain-containing protein [Thermodesulfatator autotrophicus]OAG27352.1 hypothetical protein TH606_07375 [Thermodesulfatator autotrophicus]